MRKRPEYTRIKLRELRRKKYGKGCFKGKKILTKDERRALAKKRRDQLNRVYELFDMVRSK